MEGDSIRANGSKVVVDIWIDGAIRSIAVSRSAIAANVGRDTASAMNDDERCAFVRAHLPLVVAAARVLLERKDPGVTQVLLGDGALAVGASGKVGDRRRGDRRKAERRRMITPRETLPVGERRRAQRRRVDRRLPGGSADS